MVTSVNSQFFSSSEKLIFQKQQSLVKNTRNFMG
jgi:hypothetical protein